MAKKAVKQKLRDPDGLARTAAAQGVLAHACKRGKSAPASALRVITRHIPPLQRPPTRQEREKRETHAAHSPGVVCTPRCTLLLLRAAAIAYAVRKRGLRIRREEKKEKEERAKRKMAGGTRK